MIDTRPTLYMLVGVPASGKTTWIKSKMPDNGIWVLKTSDHWVEEEAKRLETTYDAVWHDYVKQAEKLMYKDLALALESGLSIIWDQTNYNRKTRAKKLIMIPDTYRKLAIVFPPPEKKEHERRLASRPGKTIPKVIIESMIDFTEVPKLDEGFDEVMTINGFKIP